MKTSTHLRLARAAATAAALATLMGACSFIPVHERPEPPVATAWADAGTAAGTPATDLAWADFLTDARLRALVEIALKNNRDLRIAVLNVEQVRALYGVQRADRLPSLGVGATFNRAANGSGDNYSVGFAVSAFELDLFGRVKSLSEAALARYLASDEGRRVAQMSLIAAVANAELALRADDELLQVTRATLASREEALRLVRVRLDGGVAAEPELRGAESLLAGGRANLAALQRQRVEVHAALALQ
ncbi:MAG: TolC family protein, partial [Rubrivivax sp.]|nr:TolC family protein [Rubrivivax sp.]